MLIRTTRYVPVFAALLVLGGCSSLGAPTPSVPPGRTASASSTAPISAAPISAVPISAAPVTSLAARIAAIVGPTGTDVVSIAAVDDTTSVRFRYGATGGMTDASVSKLEILESLLLRHVDAQTALSDNEDVLATAMIEHSDNNAGQVLWDGLGQAPAMSTLGSRLGLTATHPDPNGYYGLTTTSADDQLTLLTHLVTDGPLDSASRSYALGLLRQIEPDQAWGVTAAADSGATSAVKNGWLAVDSDGDRWAVNSVGVITAHGHQLLLAVMTQHDSGEQAGIALVERLARAVAADI